MLKVEVIILGKGLAVFKEIKKYLVLNKSASINTGKMCNIFDCYRKLATLIDSIYSSLYWNYSSIILEKVDILKHHSIRWSWTVSQNSLFYISRDLFLVKFGRF